MLRVSASTTSPHPQAHNTCRRSRYLRRGVSAAYCSPTHISGAGCTHSAFSVWLLLDHRSLIGLSLFTTLGHFLVFALQIAKNYFAISYIISTLCMWNGLDFLLRWLHQTIWNLNSWLPFFHITKQQLTRPGWTKKFWKLQKILSKNLYIWDYMTMFIANICNLMFDSKSNKLISKLLSLNTKKWVLWF